LADLISTRLKHRMHYPANVVSIHPYFRVHPGKLAEFTAAFPAFIEKTRSEDKNLYYEYTVNGDEIFCREAYVGAAGALAHLANIGPLLAEMFKIADLVRLEVHGPSADLDQLRGPLADFKPTWFTLAAGLRR
jgi:quinol monooxygenase YgiN